MQWPPSSDPRRPLQVAHLSDLHLGQSRARSLACERLVDHLWEAKVDHLAITGDITHGGQLREWGEFQRLFERFLRTGQVTVVPGNHDRCGDDAASLISKGRRVWVERHGDAAFVCLDSTAPHNRLSFRAHGALCQRTLEEVEAALRALAQPDVQGVFMLLHHHVVPLPVEHIGEWFANLFGWPHASELGLGHELLKRLLGRCDWVLHGHRHRPRRFAIEGTPGKPLHILNAGSSTQLLACRVISTDSAQAPRTCWLRMSRRGPRLEPVDAAVPLLLPA